GYVSEDLHIVCAKLNSAQAGDKRYSNFYSNAYFYITMKKLFFLLLAGLTAACNQTDKTTSHVVVTGIDSTKRPGDDFFTYVNGIWYDTVQIPASQTGVGSYSFLNF